MNTYSHVVPQLQQDAARRMNSLFTDGYAAKDPSDTV
jgi:hypothetical protein